MPKKSKAMPKGTRQGKALSPVEKEVVRSTFALTNNKRETARLLHLSEKVIYNVLNEPEIPDVKLNEYRAQGIRRMASRVHDVNRKILESITPEDYESGRIPIRDAKGKIIKYQYYGPSLVAKATAVGILTDKETVLIQNEAALLTDQKDGALVVPNEVKALIAGIRGKVKTLSILGIRLETDHPNLSQQIADAVSTAEVIETEVTPVEDQSEFDNPTAAD